MEEKELIRKAKEGDGDSLDAILRKYSPLVRIWTRKSFIVGGDIEDLQQEGLLAVLGAIKMYDDTKNDNFSVYVKMCVKTRIIDAIRSATRNKHKMLNSATGSDDFTELVDKQTVTGIPDPLSEYLTAEWREDFYDKLNSLLNAEQLELLKLYFEGFSYVEIADKLMLSTKKVDNTLFAIKNKLKKSKNLFN